MDKMASLSGIPIILLVLVLMILYLGNSDVLSRTLSNRIEALERRETEQTVRIELLEKQVLGFMDKLLSSSSSNHELQQLLANKAMKHQDKENNTVNVKQDFADEIDAIIKKTTEQSDKIEQLTALFGDHKDGLRLSYEHFTNDGNEKKENGKYDVEPEKEDFEEKEVDTGRDSLNKATRNTSHRTINAQTKTGLNAMKLHQKITSSKNLVAFHARQMRDSVKYQNINDVIRFENVTLNQGSGYHFRQGLFIAPQAGLYLFSVTISADSNSGYNIWASVKKNGAALARINCLGSDKEAFDQSSVTLITQMEFADEVWTDIYSEGNVSIGGNGFSSFTGILLY